MLLNKKRMRTSSTLILNHRLENLITKENVENCFSSVITEELE